MDQDEKVQLSKLLCEQMLVRIEPVHAHSPKSYVTEMTLLDYMPMFNKKGEWANTVQ
jgi:hypothetical protein